MGVGALCSDTMSHHTLTATGTNRPLDRPSPSVGGSLAVYAALAVLFGLALLAASYPGAVAGALASFGLVSVAMRSD